MNFGIYQFRLSYEARVHLNKVGSWITAAEEYPEIEIQRDVYNGGSEGFKAWMSKYYKNTMVVLNVDEDEGLESALEQVFHSGNGYINGDPCKYEEVHMLESARSASVGDIIVCFDTRRYYMIEPVGFTEITNFTPNRRKEVA